ncbi:MAG: hypothetical protein U0167_00115 [bacterium]
MTIALILWSNAAAAGGPRHEAYDVETIDLDFDGHADLRVLEACGGTWGRYTHYLLDPRQDCFVRNGLTTAMDEALAGNGVAADAEGTTLRVGYLVFEGTIEEVFAPVCDTLRLVGHTERVRIDPEADVEVQWRLEDDGWKVVRCVTRPLAEIYPRSPARN